MFVEMMREYLCFNFISKHFGSFNKIPNRNPTFFLHFWITSLADFPTNSAGSKLQFEYFNNFMKF